MGDYAVLAKENRTILLFVDWEEEEQSPVAVAVARRKGEARRKMDVTYGVARTTEETIARRIYARPHAFALMHARAA